MRSPVYTFLLCTLVFSCSSSKDNYAVDKQYWDVEDYRIATTQLDLDNLDQKELPNLDNPSMTLIFNKMVDTNNITVITNDEQLGIIHRAAFTSEMFDQYKELDDAYDIIDRTDKYTYPKEFVAIGKFGLALQLHYIRTNNEKILKEADNAQDPEVVRVIVSNQDVLIKNFTLYLDRVNREDQFSDEALNSFAEGIDYYFPRLLQQAHDGDYSPMIEKTSSLLSKVKHPKVKSSLEGLDKLLQSKKVPVQ